MSLIKCPECGRLISDTAKACPNCGYSFEVETLSDVLEELREQQRTAIELDQKAKEQKAYEDYKKQVSYDFTSLSIGGTIILGFLNLLPLEWTVVDIKNGLAYLVLKKPIGSIEFDKKRDMLKELYFEAFDDTEKGLLVSFSDEFGSNEHDDCFWYNYIQIPSLSGYKKILLPGDQASNYWVGDSQKFITNDGIKTSNWSNDKKGVRPLIRVGINYDKTRKDFVCLGKWMNETLSWKIIFENNEMYMLMCNQPIGESCLYKSKKINGDYSQFDIVKFLEKFYKSAFDNDEKELIVGYKIDGNEYPVFILDSKEVKKYIPSVADRMCFDKSGKLHCWWLRSKNPKPHYDGSLPYDFVNPDGNINKYGNWWTTVHSVRPVICIKK